MFENPKTALVIVADKKHMKYANYMMALLGQNDDQDNHIVGVKDGTVSAAVFTLERYKDNEFTSNTHVLFIGDFKEAKEIGSNISYTFDKYGMRFGWIGKRAVMYVDRRMLNKEEFKDFLYFSNSYKKTLTLSTKAMMKNYPAAVKWLAELLPFDVDNNVVSRFFSKKKTRDQQYRCLTMAMYLEGLQKFMEG